MDWVREQLERVGCSVHPKTRMTEVDVAQRQLIELAKALAIEPKILVLDEPTAPLTADLVDLLFEKIRAAAARGAAIIYISHRLQEVRQIADRVTVMRDGEVKGSAPVDEMSDEEMLRLIVGRTVTSVFPAKGKATEAARGALVVRNLSGAHFHDVSMTARGGEIVGIAGITGNGQSEFLRAARRTRRRLRRDQARRPGAESRAPRVRLQGGRHFPLLGPAEGRAVHAAVGPRERRALRPAASSHGSASSAGGSNTRASRSRSPPSASGRRRSTPTSPASPAATSRR